MRDGDWLKGEWKKLVSQVSLCWDRFTRSGSQNGDATSSQGIEEWVLNFAHSFNQPVQYAILALDMVTMRNLGKVIPGGGRDAARKLVALCRPQACCTSCHVWFDIDMRVYFLLGAILRCNVVPSPSPSPLSPWP